MQSPPKSARFIISCLILALAIVLPVVGFNRLTNASALRFWSTTVTLPGVETAEDFGGTQQPQAITTAYTVNSLADTNTGSGTSGTLRYCITQANTAGGTNTITFSVTGTILLSSSLPNINNSLTIDGPGPDLLTISGNNSVRVVAVNNNLTVTFQDLTIANGRALNSQGGAIDANASTVTLQNCVFDNNFATFDGGAVRNNGGNMTVTNCLFSNNTSAEPSGQGGGLKQNGASMTVTGSTFINNSADAGGGFHVGTGTTNTIATNCTFYGNTATFGGAVEARASATFQNCTFTRNVSSAVGGINAIAQPVTLVNTIISGNLDPNGNPSDLEIGGSGTINTANSFNNLVGTPGGSGLINGTNGNQVGVLNPKLVPVGNYGGLVPTVPIRPSSAARNAGRNTGAPATDARGFNRPQATTVDIGAFELQTNSIVTNTLNSGAGSLRDVVAAAPVSEIVQFESPLFDSAQTISLSGGQITLSKHQAIVGPAANLLTVQCTAAPGSTSRSFLINSGVTAILGDMKIANNQVTTEGGGISNQGILTVQTCLVDNNTSNDQGGGISNNGTLTVIDSTISNNTATSLDGGGIGSYGALTVTGSTFIGNSANVNGGGIAILNGGALQGSLTATNSTFSANQAAVTGGGISFDTSMSNFITNCTLTLNQQTNGGSSGGGLGVAAGSVTLKNTIIAGNTKNGGTQSDITTTGGTVSAASSFNLIGTGGSGGLTNGVNNNQVGVTDAKLTPLGNYGGSTLTHMLSINSPAMNTGTSSGAPTTDQRGVKRSLGGTFDIGAVEAYITVTPTSIPTGTAGAAYPGQTFSASGGSGDYTFGLIGTLPSGMFFSPIGADISGTPTQSGFFPIVATATDNTNGIVGATSYTLVINDQTLHHFAIANISSPKTAGTAFNITITAQDASNNTVSGFTGTVNLTTNAGTITPTTSNAFTNGVLTQSVTLTQSGTLKTISVNDGSGHTGTSNTFTVNAGAVDHFAIATISSPQIAGTAFNISLTAQDVNNNTVTGFAGTVTMTTNAGTISPATSGAFTSGTRTQSVSVTQSGTLKTISVNDASAHTGTSNTFTVNAGALHHFAIDTISSPQTAGTAFNITLTAQDLNNNTVTSFSSTATLSTTAGTITPTTTGAFSSGTRTESVSVTQAGTGKTISVTDGIGHNGSSNTFTVNGGALHHFVIGNISTVAAGTPFNLAVTAQDINNNTASSFTGTVSLTTTAGTITPTTSNAFTAGTLNQSVTVTLAGTGKTISIDDGAGRTATSNTFTVNTGALHHFTFATISSPQTAGTAFNITMTAQDSNNNTLTGFVGTVNLSTTAGTITPATSGAFSSGTRTESVSVTQAGTGKTITLNDGAGHTLASNTFTVNAGVLHHFAIGNISTVIAGTPFNIALTAQDLNNNTVTGFAGTVNLTTTAGSITPTTSGAFSSGMLNQAVTVTQAGTGKTISLDDGAGHTVTSNTFTVNAGAVDHFVIATISSPQTAGSAFSITMTAQDLNNNTATGFVGTVNFSTTAGTITPATSGAFASGTRTESVSVTQAGTGKTISVTDGIGHNGTSNTFTVNAGALHHFAIGNISSPQVAGTPFNIALTAQDINNNTVTGFAGTVSLSTTAGSITPTTSSAFSSGMLNQAVTVTQAGTGKTISLNDGAGHTTTSNTFTVNAGAVHHFTIDTISSPQTAGTAFNISITAQDINNNTATGFTGTANLSTTAGTITPATTGAFTSGTRTESVSVSQVGTGKTISVTDGIGHNGTSNTFNVATGALHHFAIGNISNPQVAGTPFNIALTAQDINNNTVTSFIGTVNLSTTAGTISPTTSSAFSAGFLNQTVTVTQTGTGKTISLDDGAGHTTTSNTFTVNAGAVHHFTIDTISSPQTAGTPFNITMTAQDINNNTVTGFNGTGNLSTTAGSISPTTSGAFSSGIRTESVSVSQAGTGKTISVTDGIGHNGTSNTFTVNGGALHHFAIGNIGTQGAGTPFNIALTAQDINNNTVTSFVGTVNLTTTAGSITPTTSSAFSAGFLNQIVTVTQAGTGKTISLDDGAGHTATSNIFTVNAGAVHHFVIDTISSPQTAGTAFNITITAQDINNNLVPGFASTANLSTTAGTITPATTGAFINGIRTESVSVSQAGTGRTISVTDGIGHNGISNTFTVNGGALHHFAIGNISSPRIAGTPFNIALTAQDINNNTVTSFTGTVNLTTTAGNITPVTSGAFSGGMLNQIVTVTQAGTGKTITVDDGAGHTATSNTFTVNTGAVDHFVIDTISSPQTAGTAFNITITAQDINNNIATGFNGTVNLSTTGSISPTTTGAFINGIRTESVAVTQAGLNKTISVTDGIGHNGTSNTFTVTGGALHHFAIGNISSPQIAGTPFNIALTAQDINNNTATGFTGIVNLSTTAGSITPTTSAAFSAGMLNQIVTVTQAGTGKTISLDDGAGHTATSNTFTVNVGAVHHFAISTISSPQTTGTPFNITITAQDSNNNTVTGFAGTVSLNTTAGLISPITSGAFTSGVRTENVSVSQAGTGRTISVNDGAGHSGTSNAFTVDSSNTAPGISGASVTRTAGSPGSNSTIATVTDAESGAAAVTVTVTSANPSNGVTVSNIVNSNGTISANIIAACGASNASFTLQASDGMATSTATLTVTVNANPLPTLTYSNQNVAANGSLTINPATGLSDNGSIASVIVQSQGTYTGTISVNSSGVVSISNASPSGLHTITIRATDNCEDFTNATFTLMVNCPTITVNPASLPNGTQSTGYNQTITPSGGSSANYTYGFTGTLPTGVTLSAGPSATATLSGTPTAGGSFNFTIIATDTNGCTGSKTYAVTINAQPTISAVGVSRQQGSPATNSTIANVNDVESGATGVTITVNGSTSATVNGVTVSSILNSNGTVTANVGATCAATTASFTLTATDGGGATSTATLTVTVTPDMQAPTISCPANITAPTDVGQCSAIVTFTTPTGSDNCGSPTVVCSPASGSTFPKGTTTVTCTATDGGSNTASCNFTVTVNDTIAPTINCPANITASSAAQCSAVVTYTTPTASDNCSGVGTVTCTPASGSTFAAGTTTVNCSVSDAAGNPASCSFTVTVNDSTPPSLNCPMPISVSTATNQCQATVSYTTPVASDNCSGVGTVTCIPASGSNFPKGTTTVNCSVSDAAGNPASCSFTVTVNDMQNPTLSNCPGNINASTGSSCAVVTYMTPTVNDNCPGAMVSCVPPSGTCFALGTATVSCTATDSSSNTAQCTFTVNVAACTISCASNITVSTDAGQCSAVVTYANPSATGSCGTVSCSPVSGSTFPKGITTVTCMMQNGPSCSFTVTVNDTQAPESCITAPANLISWWAGDNNANDIQGSNHGTLMGNATANGSGKVGQAFNLNGTSAFVQVADKPEWDFANSAFTIDLWVNFNQVNNPSTFIAHDDGQGANNKWVFRYTGGNLQFHTNDTQNNSVAINAAFAPAVNTWYHLAVTRTGSTYTLYINGAGTPTTNAAAVPNASANLTIGWAEGSTGFMNGLIDEVEIFNRALSAGEIQAIVNAGSFGKCKPVTVNAITNQCSATNTYTTPSFSDNCTGAAVVCNPPADSTFPVGTTTINCTVTDMANNTFTNSFPVRVKDVQAPVIGACPANQTVNESAPGSGSAIVSYTAPTASDNCSGQSVTCNPPSGSSFSVGTTTVTCTATDASGNTASCTFTITVNSVCAITCPANVTTNNDLNQCGATVNYTAPTTNGGCGKVTCSPAPGSFFPKGTTTVTCNTTAGLNCSFTVTVNDTQIPTIACSNLTRAADANQCSAVVNYALPVASDNCAGVGTVTCTPSSGSTFAKGTTTVNCSVKDAGNNQGTGSFTVTVNDTQNPAISCPANLVKTISLGGGTCMVVNYATPVATDNCSGATVICSPASGSCFPVGVTTVNCTATDASGNTALCSFTVNIFDICLQDDSNPGSALSINSLTGEYRFCCSGTTYTGIGTITKKGSTVTLEYTDSTRRVYAKVDKAAGTATAWLQQPPGTNVCTITDRNMANNSCTCQ
jgi:hypothetical protein